MSRADLIRFGTIRDCYFRAASPGVADLTWGLPKWVFDLWMEA